MLFALVSFSKQNYDFYKLRIPKSDLAKICTVPVQNFKNAVQLLMRFVYIV
jgi:hypothetical protein